MSYLEEFRLLIEEEKLTHFLRLWEEYCSTDQVDGPELVKVLQIIKNSIFAPTFGQFAESVLPMWKHIENQPVGDEVLRLILDLQTTNSPLLGDLAITYLKKHYGQQKYYNEKLRLVGLRSREHFEGAITNFELLTHMEKGKFVFHTGGWGVGEVIEISLIQEHVILEFEGINALKDLTFDNAFKNLVALSSEHFLACRFGNPDLLEKEGKENPIGLIRHLLRDLGPKTAQEIKDELCELVIPEKDWTKWWQITRAKIKKDTKIQSPELAKGQFVLRDEAVSHDTRLKESLKEVKGIDSLIQLVYSYTRDFPEILKNGELKEQLKRLLLDGLAGNESILSLNLARKIQITFLLEDIFPDEFPKASANLILPIEDLENVIHFIEIVAFKKKTLTVVREVREDWASVFLHLLFMIEQNTLRDYIFKELQNDEKSKPLLQNKIHDLLNKMTLFPEAFFWYFQKIVGKEDVFLNDQESQFQFLEAYLILLHYVEVKPEMRDLAKKMYQYLIAKRYAVIRQMIEGASVEYLKEFLLLASKCQSFTQHDQKIFQSLAEVVQPSMGSKKKSNEEEEIIWTTQEGLQKIQERIHRIGTVETVDNAREIEAARALGDLRENSEYKFALERRARLQGELKLLTRQLNQARILTEEDVSLNEVCVGVIVDLSDSNGNQTTYTLLGPWDADPEKHILSFQSKLAQSMIGMKQGESFDFQGQKFTVKKIKSYLS